MRRRIEARQVIVGGANIHHPITMLTADGSLSDCRLWSYVADTIPVTQLMVSTVTDAVTDAGSAHLPQASGETVQDAHATNWRRYEQVHGGRLSVLAER